MSDEPLIAVFIDFENLAIGVRQMKAGKFQIQLVLKRLLEKGRSHDQPVNPRPRMVRRETGPPGLEMFSSV